MKARRSAPETWRKLAAVVAVLALWGMLAPYAGRLAGFEVNTRPIVEVIDHVVPGLVLLLLAALAGGTGRGSLPAALLGVLAAFWMVATHVPLVVEAAAGGVEWGAAMWHSLPGLLLLVITLWGALIAYRTPADPSLQQRRLRTPSA